MNKKSIIKVIMIFSLIILHPGINYAGGLSKEKKAYILNRFEKLKAQYKRGEISWKPGITPYTFMTTEQLKATIGIGEDVIERFFEKSNESCTQVEEVSPPMVVAQAESLPSHFDWRSNNGNWVTPVKQQHGGSCWAYASIALLETSKMIYGLESDQDIDLSEAFLCDCSRIDPKYDYPERCLKGCNGSTEYKREFVSPLRYLVEEGTVPEDCLPSDNLNTCGYQFFFLKWGCENRCSNWEERIVRASDYKVIANYDELPQGEAYSELISAIKQAIIEHGLIYAGVHTSLDFVLFYTGGIYRGNCKNDQASIDHAVAIVGWDEGNQCWIVKNSWGTSWGNGGYFKIGWESCGISLCPAYLTYGHEDGEVSSIAIPPDRDDTIYVTVKRENASDFLYRSLDGGESWKIIRGFYNYNEVLHEEGDYWDEIKEYYDDEWAESVVALNLNGLMLLNNNRPLYLSGDIEDDMEQWLWYYQDYYKKDGKSEDVTLWKIKPDPTYTAYIVYGIDGYALWYYDFFSGWKKISDRGGSDFAVSRWGPIYFVDVSWSGGIYYLESDNDYYSQLIKYHTVCSTRSVAVCPSNIYRSIVGISKRWGMTGYGDPPDYFGFDYGRVWKNASGYVEGSQSSIVWPSYGNIIGVGNVTNPNDSEETSVLPLISKDYGVSWSYPFNFPEDTTVNPEALAAKMYSSTFVPYVGGSIKDGYRDKPAIFKGPFNWETIIVE